MPLISAPPGWKIISFCGDKNDRVHQLYIIDLIAFSIEIDNFAYPIDATGHQYEKSYMLTPDRMVLYIEEDSAAPFNAKPFDEWLRVYRGNNPHLTICLTDEEYYHCMQNDNPQAIEIQRK